MSRVCALTGKVPHKGRSYSYRGIAKKNKGIGLNITGSSKRRHKPNLMKTKIWSCEKKRFFKMKISAHALRIIDRVGLDKALKSIPKR